MQKKKYFTFFLKNQTLIEYKSILLTLRRFLHIIQPNIEVFLNTYALGNFSLSYVIMWRKPVQHCIKNKFFVLKTTFWKK
jgi:hypothetical protein